MRGAHVIGVIEARPDIIGKEGWWWRCNCGARARRRQGRRATALRLGKLHEARYNERGAR